MLSFLTASENLPFSAALGIMLVIGLLEGVFTLMGLGLSQFFEHLIPGGGPEIGAPPAADLHVDLHADPGLDPHHGFDLDKASPGLRFLDWLHVGKVPILVVFVVFLTMFGFVGLGLQWTALTFFQRLIPTLFATVPALAISLPLVRFSTGLLARVLPKDETQAVSQESFVGRVAVVTLGTARRGHPAQAKLRDQFGLTHYVAVEPDLDDEQFTAGTAVLIVRRSGIIFRGIRNTTSALID